MRNRKRIWPGQIAHKRATYEGPLPLAIIGMLELTPRPGQANADRENYDFSLGTLIFRVFQAFQPSSRRPRSVNNLRLTLATVWWIAAPYFRSEDKFAGRLLLASVIVIEITVVGINFLLNRWNTRFYNRAERKNWDGFVRE